jgi:hypothetical protein
MKITSDELLAECDRIILMLKSRQRTSYGEDVPFYAGAVLGLHSFRQRVRSGQFVDEIVRARTLKNHEGRPKEAR